MIDVMKFSLMAFSALVFYGLVTGYRYFFEAKLPVRDKDFNLDIITKNREQLPAKARAIIRKAYSANRMSRWERMYLDRRHSRIVTSQASTVRSTKS